jgi:hypothetical protein
MKVLSVKDANIRQQIEDFTKQNCAPHTIAFTEDGDGLWFVTTAVVDNPVFAEVRDLLITHGEWNEYTPISEE